MAKKSSYTIQTGPEADAIMRATADGQSGRNWVDVPEGLMRVHQTKDASHCVRLFLPPADWQRQSSELVTVTDALNADNAHMMLVINQLLSDGAGRATVHLDAIADAIGWVARSTEERKANRRRTWDFIKFIASCRVIGQRTYKQRTRSGEILDTTIDAVPWAILEREHEAAQFSLFADEEVPISVHLVASPTWARLTMQPDTAQFLDGGEVLGAISSGHAAGAWARCIGLALASFWRRNPLAATEGKLKPTRRELLERYSATTAPLHEVLKSQNNTRAIQYWVNALRILVEIGFIADEGEATLSYQSIREALPPRSWWDSWLDSKVDIKPGTRLAATVGERAEALPTKKHSKV